jgi:hypothetical protein
MMDNNIICSTFTKNYESDATMATISERMNIYATFKTGLMVEVIIKSILQVNQVFNLFKIAGLFENLWIF